MASFSDRVHSHGMSPNQSTRMTVNTFIGPDNEEIPIRPPLQIIFESEAANVAFLQDGLTARYHDDELRKIGEGSSTLGMQRVIGDIATRRSLIAGATKPLHPGLIDGEIVMQQVLPPASLEVTA